MRKLLRTIEKLQEHDVGSLKPLLESANTDVLIGVFGYYEDRLDLHESLKTPPFSYWDRTVRDSIFGVLRSRGLIYAPSWFDEFLPENWRELISSKKT